MMHSLNDDFYVLTGKIFCRLLNTHPAPQVLIYSVFFDIPDQVDHDQKKCRCFIDTLIWLRDNSYIRYSQLLAVGAADVVLTEKTLCLLNAMPTFLQPRPVPFKESLLDAVKTGENAVIAECVSRIMRYVFNERK
ncbi:hypothetical protein MLM51_08255 [Escherichia coli]|uniref:hypothetical protein n=1 Tax=Escherichia coli TaxID=562 RepID=UPI000BE83C7A|nr:hypothetical protein [Escherichia coli]MCN2101984.1 hypothetical protein [Escherichia coli]HAY0859179.1 hypothetical protein [Escherichia coli]HAY0929395.1 hypothetical protein [Escherichia coli]